jgi:hypothetical protein
MHPTGYQQVRAETIPLVNYALMSTEPMPPARSTPASDVGPVVPAYLIAGGDRFA